MKLTIKDGRDHFYTFDTNRILLLTATDEENIRQVEFSTEENGEEVSWTSEVLTGSDGIKYVQVPNEFLNGDYSRLVCYYVALDSNGEYTRQKEVFRIRARQEPQDYYLTYSERVTFASIKALTEQYKATTKQYMDTTEGFKDNAGRSAELASKYAENNEDVAVEPGKYSAKHWSIKAEAAKETAVQKATEAGTSEVNSKTYMESAQSAKQDAETAKNAANTILEQVQSKGTEITNFVATSKTEIETQKNESVNAVKSVYQTDLNELKGDLSQKISKPTENPNGANGQVLRSNGDGSTKWVNEGLPTDAQTERAITDWLNEHPEATTTVQDRSIAETKLSNDVLQNLWNNADTKREPIVSFTADDGTIQDITVMGEILKRYGVPATCALITDTMANTEMYKDMQDNYGWEIASHSTDSVLLGTLTDAEIETRVKNSKKALEDIGFNVNAFVFPSGSASSRVRRIVKKYYRSAYNYDDRVNNDMFLDSWSIHRVPLGAFYTTETHNTLEYYKSCVDSAYKNNGWCIFCLHPYKDDFDETQQQYLEELIQYIQSKNIKTTTLSEGYKVFGNIIESGESYDTGTEDKYQRFVVSNDGRTNLPIYFAPSYESLSTKVPKDFRNRVVTLSYISKYTDNSFPDGASGIVVTIKINDICTQLWLPKNSNRIYKRQRNNDDSFNAFSLITPILSKTGINNYSATQSANAYPSEQITVTEVTNGTNLGFPTKEGTLITKKLQNYTSQMFIPSDTDTSIYRRHWDSANSVWTSFVNICSVNDGSFSKIISMYNTWVTIPISFSNWLYIDKFESMQGNTPVLAKQKWEASEISTDESNPTTIGTISATGKSLFAYKDDNNLYIRYSSVGNNYPALLSIMYL